MNRFPDFGAELNRPFAVDENCYDCAEFYYGCNATPENPNARCLDYLRLPNVGVHGKTGQDFPPSRMGGRKEPRIRAKDKPEPVRVALDGARSSTCQRQASPVATKTLDGKRLCGCEAVLGKGERCCKDCRLQRRHDSLHQRRHSPASHGMPDLPSTGPGMAPTQARTGAHN